MQTRDKLLMSNDKGNDKFLMDRNVVLDTRNDFHYYKFLKIKKCHIDVTVKSYNKPH